MAQEAAKHPESHFQHRFQQPYFVSANVPMRGRAVNTHVATALLHEVRRRFAPRLLTFLVELGGVVNNRLLLKCWFEAFHYTSSITNFMTQKAVSACYACEIPRAGGRSPECADSPGMNLPQRVSDFDDLGDAVGFNY
jgi:hypothetical protein